MQRDGIFLYPGRQMQVGNVENVFHGLSGQFFIGGLERHLPEEIGTRWIQFLHDLKSKWPSVSFNYSDDMTWGWGGGVPTV